ncbi:LamG domain-containing protein [Streptomyces sp. AK08-02]|uniref:LamG domain-containing protein n=1 Tax=Streptomyces sp. AK08-02 TaxID=3028654 RepID=UPI0029AFBC65|nr:LamG domain-containing protein [Streptomyces sp. AK08-02]MDX3752480.1 LamG domain-containing protein [Streptomyces sp. AK08-02]
MLPAAQTIGRARRLVSGLTVTALLAALPALGVTSSVAQADDAEPPTSEASAALEQAKASGEAVEVVGAREEYATTHANPDGYSFTLTKSVVPVRVAQPDGSWAEPDATLERRVDGSIGPKASVVDISLSAGGDGGGLVKLAEDGRSLSLGWPGSLPKPVLDGASATYAEVLPGVDLRMTATVEGVRQVLIVKSAEAAANPELERIEFSLKTQGLTVATRAGGGLAAMDEDGNAVFRSPAAQMWDSAGDTAGTGTMTMSLAAVDDEPVVDGHGEISADPADGPGNGDASAVLPVELTEDAVAVVPDAGLLSGENTVYPLYIDPDVGLEESERTVLSSDGDTFYNFSGGDDGEGVGYCDTYVTGGFAYYCGSGYKQRMYFEFGPTGLAGKKVLDAKFRVTEKWSMSCQPSTVDLVRTGGISSATRWPGPTSSWDLLGDRTVSAGRGAMCDPDQPDAPITFDDDPAQSYENLTHTVQVFAAGGFDRLTLMLKAHNENDPNSWKRFDDNAALVVTYVGLPAVPTYPGIVQKNSVICSTKPTAPTTIADPQPVLTARPQAAGGGGTYAHLQAHFYVQREQNDGTWKVETEPVRPEGSVGDNEQVKAVTPIALTPKKTYRMAVFTRSLYNNDKSYLESSSTVTTKGWCYFKIDTDGPKAPVITFVAPYRECPANDCQGFGGPGIKGKFTFSRNPGDDTINSGYRYKLSTDEESSQWFSGDTVTVWITPSRAGTITLEVQARDSAGEGDTAAVDFKVAEGQPAVGRWHFDGPSKDPAADSATEGVRHPMTLHGAGSGRSSAMARRGDGDLSLWLNGDPGDATRQSGYADTSEAVVDTRYSFTASAWAKLSDASTYRTVLSQTGSDNSSFSLYYSSGAQRWVFLRSWYENGVRQSEGADASATGVPLDTWVHVAGSYDAENRAIRLYVNGRPQGGSVALPSTSDATVAGGPLQVGRVTFTSGGTYQNYMSGQVDEVAVWQRLLTDDDVATEAQLLDENNKAYVERVADWKPNGATAGTNVSLADAGTGYGRSLKLSNGASLDSTAIVLDGTNDTATAKGPVVDDTGAFTVTTAVELDGEAMALKPDGYISQVVGQRGADGSSWGLWFEKTAAVDDPQTETKTVEGTWYFGRLSKERWTAVVSKETTRITPNSITQLTGVFDASARTISLYVGGSQNGLGPGYTAVAGSGDFAVGTGFVDSAWGHYLAGRITRIRIWAGAMSGQQVSDIVSRTDG